MRKKKSGKQGMMEQQRKIRFLLNNILALEMFYHGKFLFFQLDLTTVRKPEKKTQNKKPDGW